MRRFLPASSRPTPPIAISHRNVADDEELAARTRELLATEDGITGRAMFGGLGRLVPGNMASPPAARTVPWCGRSR